MSFPCIPGRPSYPSVRSNSFPSRDRVFTKRTTTLIAQNDSFAEILPIAVGEFADLRNLEIVQRLVRQQGSVYRLNHAQRLHWVEQDREVCSRQFHISEERTEPLVRVNYPFKQIITMASRVIDGRAYNKAVIGACARKQTRPNLHDTRLWKRRQERWAIPPRPPRGGLVKVRAEIGKLCFVKRNIPFEGPTAPSNIVSIEQQPKCDRWEYVPP